MKRFIAVLIVLGSMFGTYFLYAAITGANHAYSAQVIGSTDDADEAASVQIEGTSRSATLEHSLDDVLSRYENLTIGVTIVDIDNDYTYNSGYSDTAFRAASTTKVLTAVYLMRQIESGRLSLQTNIGGITAETHLQRMLQNSDNTSWAMLINYLGDDAIELYAHEIGMISYTAGDYNTVTTSDFAVLLAKLQKLQLTTASSRNIMYSYMQDTNNEMLIPAAISNSTVYHKWGLLWGNLHDIAIIEQAGHMYAVVIYTNYENNTSEMNTLQTTAIHEIVEVFQRELAIN